MRLISDEHPIDILKEQDMGNLERYLVVVDFMLPVQSLL